MSAVFAPTTFAIRSGFTNGQLRQTNACRRSGKCGNETGFGAAPFGVRPGQTPSARLPGEVAVEVLWQQGADLTVMVTTPSRGAEIQAVATRIRETASRLQALPESPALARARADLAAAKDLLVQMKPADASARLDAVDRR